MKTRTHSIAAIALGVALVGVATGECLAQEQAAAEAPGCQVAISALFMQISPKLAAEWGLDGGPASAPATTPLKKEIPRILRAEEAQLLITALRAQPDTVIAGSVTCVALSGNTCVFRNVKEFPAGEDEEARDCGAVMTVTPTVSADGKFVDLDLRPQLTRFMGYIHGEGTRRPVYAAVTAETKVMLPIGSTVILAGGVPALETLGPVGEEYPAGMASGHDGRPVLIFVTVTLLL